MLPFTHEQFLDVFATYNRAVWPAPLVAYAVGLGVLGATRRPTRAAAVAVAGGLALMWLWTGVAYHLAYFSAINAAAYGFGAAFVAQAFLLALAGWRGQLRFPAKRGLRPALGWGLVLYAMALYPLIGIATGARYPQLPMFGITPCPLTLFTLGVMLLASGRVPWWLLAIPATWSVVGGSAAFLLSVAQDWALLFGVVAIVPLAIDNARSRRTPAPAT
jgi:hypothetical protein